MSCIIHGPKPNDKNQMWWHSAVIPTLEASQADIDSGLCPGTWQVHSQPGFLPSAENPTSNIFMGDTGAEGVAVQGRRQRAEWDRYKLRHV